jgi:hypothetical protein
MPRPKRKPKPFKRHPTPSSPRQPVSVAPHPEPAPPDPPRSTEQSPMPRDSGEDHAVVVEHSDFGFNAVRGIKRTVISIPADSDPEHEEPVHTVREPVDVDEAKVPVKQVSDEDIYGDRTTPFDHTSSLSTLSPVPTPRPSSPLKKPPLRTLRTSDLLHFLPTRRKRSSKHPTKSRKPVTLGSSEDESEADNGEAGEQPAPRRRAKRAPKGGRVCASLEEDKENDDPGSEMEEEREGEGRWRDTVKSKFAEIDRWEMDFESVDLSFSSQ